MALRDDQTDTKRTKIDIPDELLHAQVVTTGKPDGFKVSGVDASETEGANVDIG